MSEFEPPAYDARTFWRQVKRGVSRLALPDDVSDPKSEVADGRIEVTVTAWGETERIVLS
ncbi:MAG: hypothetical protein F4Y79_00520 [Gemmatimonadetes bacterium]|nr:hypothetical protein [Gemmatimonadota bacterium]MYF17880.1 hypothetical protein [Gemmatimonadota bacterium]